MARILVIDDEDSLRHMIKRALATQKHEVTEAGDGKTAPALVAEDLKAGEKK